MHSRDVLQGRVEYAQQGCIAGKGCIVGTCHVEANVYTIMITYLIYDGCGRMINLEKVVRGECR